MRKCLLQRVLPLFALCLLVSSLPGATGTDAREEVREVLRARWVNDGRTREAVSIELASVGSPAIPILFGLFDGTALPAVLDLEAAGEEFDLSAWWGSPDTYGPVALEALGRMRARDVVRYLTEHNTPGATLEWRLSAVRVLGRLESSETIDLLCALASGVSDLELQYRSARAPFEQSFAAALAGDQHSAEKLRRRLDELSPAVQSLVVDAVCKSECAGGLRLLESLIDGDYGPNPRIVDALARLGDRYRWMAGERPAELLRPLLMHEDAAIRRSAAAGLERLRDPHSFRQLIVLLEDESPRVRRLGLHALQDLSNAPFDADPKRWSLWIDREEQTWWDESAELTVKLSSDDLAVALDAIRCLSVRTFYRHEVAALLAANLGDERSPVLTVTCDALGRLGSRVAVPDLVGLLRYSDDEVRAAAWGALRKLTGKDFPAEAGLWENYVRP